MTVLIECDDCLAMNQQHYCEDVIIDFEKVVICENKQFEVCDYWVKAKIVRAKSYLPLLILFNFR